jgi:hypothetical protein
MRRYFLGGLTEDERSLAEEQYLADEQAFATALAVEEELIEDYVEGRLSPEEREALDAHLRRSPRLRRSADLVAALLRSKPSDGITRRSFRWRRLAPVAAGAAALAVAGTLLWRGGVETGPPRPRAGDGASPGSPAPLEPATLAISLSPGRARGTGGSASFSVPAGTAVVRFELEVVGLEGRSLAVALRSAEGATVWSGFTAAGARERRTSAVIPAAVLGRGDYVLVLQERRPEAERRDVAEYYFRIL